MKKRRLLSLLTAWFALTCLAASAQTAARAKHVFILSFDQASPDGIEKAKMPVFKQMAKEGAHTWEAYTIVPSLTLPSHASMLTGVGVQKHQVLWNNYEKAKGLVKVPTVFSLAKEKGLKTSMFVAKEKFRHLIVPGSVDTFACPEDGLAASVADAFATEVVRSKPNLCFIHFADPDVKGHEFGINSPEKMQAYADTDAALKTVKEAIAAAGILDSSVLILTSDHGGHDIKDKNGITRGTHGDATTEDVTIPWVAWGKGVKPGATITTPVVQYDTAATALWLLGVPVPESFWGRPVIKAFQP